METLQGPQRRPPPELTKVEASSPRSQSPICSAVHCAPHHQVPSFSFPVVSLFRNRSSVVHIFNFGIFG
uniref:Uncharacterized protein n=1 Tax=Panagrolaimus sp. JU765 TaxID=591449 RepID=A0AC34RN40_9BILA